MQLSTYCMSAARRRLHLIGIVCKFCLAGLGFFHLPTVMGLLDLWFPDLNLPLVELRVSSLVDIDKVPA